MQLTHGIHVDVERVNEATFRVGDIEAERFPGPEWSRGQLGPEYPDADTIDRLAVVVAATLVEIDPSQICHTNCTEDRPGLTVDYGDRTGILVPPRKEAPGAAIVLGFHMMEAVGSVHGDVYKGGPKAPIRIRAREAAQKLKEHDLSPDTHDDCGAEGQYLSVVRNEIDFGLNNSERLREDFTRRGAVFAGSDSYDPADAERSLRRLAARVDDPEYGYLALTAGLLWQVAAVDMEGDSYRVHDSDRREGPHGHNPSAVMRFDRSIGDLAIPKRTVHELTGQQAFGTHEERIDEIAMAVADGDPELFHIARTAGTLFVEAAFGTLAHPGVPTYRYSRTAQTPSTH